MTFIRRGNVEDSLCISRVARLTFIESHGNSAPPEDINKYISEKYSEDTLKTELEDPQNIYHLLSYNGEVVGFSKIIFNLPYKEGINKNIAKLERIFILKKVYNLKLGIELLRFNLNLMKQHNQSGTWLFVWIENERAIKFYKRNGFKIVGSYYFKISENHTNPNHQMFLDFTKKAQVTGNG